MPNLMKRRKIKRQLMSAGQLPIYNIYYTDSVPTQQLPNFTGNLAKSFPRVNQISSLRTRRQPRTNGFFRRTRQFARDKRYSSGASFLPEEEQSQSIKQYTMSRAKSPTVEIYKNYEQPICSEQFNYLDYNRNKSPDDYLLSNYGFHYKKSYHAADMLELSKSYQRVLSTERTKSFDNCSTSIDSKTQNNEISFSTVDTSNQLITVPIESVNSDNDYSMNIDVPAQPLKREENVNKTIQEKSEQSLDDNDTVRKFLKKEAIGKNRERGDTIVNSKMIRGNILTTSCSFFNKKRMSLLRKLNARIRKNKAKPVSKVCRSPQTSMCPVSELAKFKNVRSTDLLAFKIQSDYSNWSDVQSNEFTLRKCSSSKEVIFSSIDDDARSFSYSAQEILSPRQMISSMTNVCSEKRYAENQLCISEGNFEYPKTLNNVRSNRSVGSNFETGKFNGFQNITDNLENALARNELITNTERKFLDDILDRHEIKLEVNEKYAERLIENEKNNNFHLKNDFLTRNILDKEGTKTMRNFYPKFHTDKRHSHEKYKNLEKLQSRTERHSTVTEENHDATSLISFICESCKLKNQDKEKEESNPSLSVDSNKYYKQKYNCPKKYVQSDYTILKSSNSVKSISKKFESSKICRHNDALNHFNDCPRNSLGRYNDHLSPERDQSARKLSEKNSNSYVNIDPSAPYLHINNKNDNPNGIYNENGNFTCCGLVMYDQKNRNPSIIRGHSCNRTIPVCGTISQGISPRYEPNFMPPPYHEQDPYWLQHPQYRYRSRDNRHCESENLHDRHRHCRRNLRQKFSEFDDGDVDDPTSNFEFSPPFVLRSLAKAANIILTTIFGRTAVRTSNRTQHKQQYRRSKCHDSVLTVRDRRVNREEMCCRMNSKNFQNNCKTQHPQGH